MLGSDSSQKRNLALDMKNKTKQNTKKRPRSNSRGSSIKDTWEDTQLNKYPTEDTWHKQSLNTRQTRRVEDRERALVWYLGMSPIISEGSILGAKTITELPVWWHIPVILVLGKLLLNSKLGGFKH